MSCYYHVNGDLILRECPEVSAIVAKLMDHNYNGDTTYAGGVLSVSIHDTMNYGSAEEIDELLKSLAPYVEQPALMYTECDDEESRLYVGPEDQRAATCSADSLDAIGLMLTFLIPEHREKLIAKLIEMRAEDATDE